jgi:hypothetical protein
VDQFNENSVLRVRFSMDDEKENLETVRTELANELRELANRPGVTSVRVKQGEVGVGYSAPGFEFIVEITRMVFDDIERLVVLGGWVLWIADRAKKRRNRMTVISDGPTLGTVRAALMARDHNLAGYRFVACRPLTGWPEYPDETDERFVWAALFEHDSDHNVLVVFMSPAGVLLGHVVVPLHSYFSNGDLVFRSPKELRDLFDQLNRGG